MDQPSGGSSALNSTLHWEYLGSNGRGMWYIEGNFMTLIRKDTIFDAYRFRTFDWSTPTAQLISMMERTIANVYLFSMGNMVVGLVLLR
jgi:hypothetical protein